MTGGEPAGPGGAVVVLARRVVGERRRPTRSLSVDGRVVGRLEHAPWRGSGVASLDGGEWLLGRTRGLRSTTATIADARTGAVVADIAARRGSRTLSVTVGAVDVVLRREWLRPNWNASAADGRVVATTRVRGFLARVVEVRVEPAGRSLVDWRLLVVAVLHAAHLEERQGSADGA